MKRRQKYLNFSKWIINRIYVRQCIGVSPNALADKYSSGYRESVKGEVRNVEFVHLFTYFYGDMAASP